LKIGKVTRKGVTNMGSWKDLIFTREDSDKKDPTKPGFNTPVQSDGSGMTSFPKLNIPVLVNPTQRDIQPVVQTPTPAIAETDVNQEPTVDPHLEKVVQLVSERVGGLAGASYQQFNAVRARMQRKLQPGQVLDLSLVCAAINASGRDLASEVGVMEQGLQTAELEVGNEIDAEERNAVSGLESEIGILDSTVSSRKSQIEGLEQQLQALRGEQLTDQRTLSQKQGQLRQQQATFTASRQRLRAARIRVAQDLAAQKRTFLEL
jgi:hypothetical protein